MEMSQSGLRLRLPVTLQLGPPTCSLPAFRQVEPILDPQGWGDSVSLALVLRKVVN